MMGEKEEQLTFEEAIERLEEVVDSLEQGDVPLEKALSMFQEGMELSKICHAKLTTVEKQIEQILTEDGEIKEGIFEEERDK